MCHVSVSSCSPNPDQALSPDLKGIGQAPRVTQAVEWENGVWWEGEPGEHWERQWVGRWPSKIHKTPEHNHLRFRVGVFGRLLPLDKRLVMGLGFCGSDTR